MGFYIYLLFFNLSGYNFRVALALQLFKTHDVNNAHSKGQNVNKGRGTTACSLEKYIELIDRYYTHLKQRARTLIYRLVNKTIDTPLKNAYLNKVFCKIDKDN